MKVGVPYFNIHDIALVLVLFQSALLTLLLLATRNRDVRSSHLLALFILSIGMEAADTLMYWCLPLKDALFADTPKVFFVFKGAVFLQGPLLYLYVRSTVHFQYSFSRREMLHFLPFALYPLYIAALFQQMGAEDLRRAVFAYDVYLKYDLFRLLHLIQPILVVGYCIGALILLVKCENGLKDQFSNLENVDKNWLKILVFGFLLIWVWNVFVNVSGAVFGPPLASLVGLIGNYLDLIFINCLVFYNLLYSNVMKITKSVTADIASVSEPKVGHEFEPADSKEVGVSEHHFSFEGVQALNRAVKEGKAYLIPDLTLDQLAKKAGLSPRVTSQIINRHFKTCFFDFINGHRVAEAKALLVDCKDKNILEISEMAGFNSKSSFNRFFRRYMEMTPTEYKRRNALPD